MSFLAGYRLWLLLGVAALAAAYVLLQRRNRHFAVRFTNLDLLASVAPRWPGWRRHLAAAALMASLATLVVGFARPTRLERIPREQATVVLAIDTSASMDATDVDPSRLAAAQEAAVSFVEQLPPAFRLALVSFNGTARVVVSPTLEHEQVAAAIDNLQLGQSTAAGEAVFTSLDVIAAAQAIPGAEGEAARIVLMSDGATTVGRSVDSAAEAAREAGVPVSTIAFGTDDGTVRIGNRLIPVPVDREAMEALAETSGGRFFEATTGEELSAVYRDIRSAIGYTTERREITTAVTGVALALAFAGVGMSLAWSGRIL